VRGAGRNAQSELYTLFVFAICHGVLLCSLNTWILGTAKFLFWIQTLFIQEKATYWKQCLDQWGWGGAPTALIPWIRHFADFECGIKRDVWQQAYTESTDGLNHTWVHRHISIFQFEYEFNTAEMPEQDGSSYMWFSPGILNNYGNNGKEGNTGPKKFI